MWLKHKYLIAENRLVNPSKNIIEEKIVMIPSKNIIEEKTVVIPSKNIIEEKIVVIPSKNIIEEKTVVNPSTSTKKMDADRAMKIHFPDVIIVDILSRLPVRSLLRFKCASKFWRSLISEPYFKTKHWNHAKNNQNFQRFLIGQVCPTSHDKWLGTMSFYCSSVSSVQLVDVQKLGCPSNDKPCGYFIVCCGDGLSLLRSPNDYLLWNPSTNESVVLPNPESPRTFGSAYGLGYDTTSDDYKILRIESSKGYGSNPPCKIFALKSGSWRKIDNHPRGYKIDNHPRRPYDSEFVVNSLAFVHGAFHWIIKDNLSKYFIASLNISNEAYGEMPLPEGICNIYNKLRYGVSVLEGMLCAHCNYRNTEGGTFKLWVMKDYGVKESWTELFTIQETQLLSATPICRFTDGEVLLYYNWARYTEYRTSKGPYRLLPASAASALPYRFLAGSAFIKHLFCYTESLISPKLLV
ncbi:F-box protein CPR1-like [Lycium barbarum]|uniref:F-box protein CPR1-like n=2 Tax=Lycium barbarum TaxID=112863 RepID=UPI00293EAF35|nr:F-box protein CPR1-like [Lycium barbarum]